MREITKENYADFEFGPKRFPSIQKMKSLDSLFKCVRSQNESESWNVRPICQRDKFLRDMGERNGRRWQEG